MLHDDAGEHGCRVGVAVAQQPRCRAGCVAGVHGQPVQDEQPPSVARREAVLLDVVETFAGYVDAGEVLVLRAHPQLTSSGDWRVE